MVYLLKKQQNDLTSTSEQATADGIGVLHVGRTRTVRLINVFPYLARVCLSTLRVHIPGAASVQPDHMQGFRNHTLYGIWCINSTQNVGKFTPAFHGIQPALPNRICDVSHFTGHLQFCYGGVDPCNTCEK